MGWGRRWAPGTSTRLNHAADVLTVGAVTLLARVLNGQPVHLGSLELDGFFALALVLWVVSAKALQHYDSRVRRSAQEDLAITALLALGQGFLLGLFHVLNTDVSALPEVGPFVLLLYLATALPRVLLFRTLRSREGLQDDVLVVGAGPMGLCTGEDLERRQPVRRVAGYLAFRDEEVFGAVPSEKLLGTAAELEAVLGRTPVNEVYIAGNPSRHGAQMQAAIATCERLGIPFALPAYSFRLDRARLLNAASAPDGYLHYVSHEVKPGQLALKRLFDLVASGLALLVLSPLLAAVALAIKLTSPGPVLFRQKRVGLHGKHFSMLKFRSMVVNADALKDTLAAKNEQAGPVFKMKDDPRVTRVGRFIRKYSIDELPQLFNVLKGDMSIVGPRPPVPKEVAQYQPWQRRRLSVRPGLTCIWQVSGRNEISFEEWMYLDMRYIDHWSLAEDLQLILKTVPVVLTGKGAS